MSFEGSRTRFSVGMTHVTVKMSNRNPDGHVTFFNTQISFLIYVTVFLVLNSKSSF